MDDMSSVQLFEGFDQFCGIETYHIFGKMTGIGNILKQITVRTIGQTEIYEITWCRLPKGRLTLDLHRVFSF